MIAKLSSFASYAAKALVAAVVVGFTPLVTQILADVPTILVGIGAAFVASLTVFYKSNKPLA